MHFSFENVFVVNGWFKDSYGSRSSSKGREGQVHVGNGLQIGRDQGRGYGEGLGTRAAQELAWKLFLR